MNDEGRPERGGLFISDPLRSAPPFAYSPIIFTSTRLLRPPSNSP